MFQEPSERDAIKTRHDAREIALEVLYSCDTTDNWCSEPLENYLTVFSNPNWSQSESGSKNLEFITKLVRGVIASRTVIDTEIGEASDRWSLARMSRVDRNILRLAAFEIIETLDTPMNVIIDEAVELAKAYGTDDSPTFVNGVLDRLARKVRGQLKTIAG